MTTTTDDAYSGTLNDFQLEVLRWIAGGCCEDVMEGPSHRVSATALQTRGLVTITGRGASWAAEITKRGEEYLERLDRQESVAEQLVNDLLAAGGVLRVPMRLNPNDIDYEARAADANRLSKVPARTKVTTRSLYGHGEVEIRLAEAADAAAIERRAVPVPERLGRPHPVAQQFRAQTDKHRVSRAQLPRCTRIVHAIASEAENRGYEIEYDGSLAITISGHHYRLYISEEKVAPRGEWDAETRQRASLNYPYLTPRKMRNYDSQATGRLTITIGHGYGRQGRTSAFADRTRWTLEQKIPDVFRELELRAAEEDVAAREEERRARERQQQWERQIERAKEQYLEAKRVEALQEQTRAWLEARSIREYVAAFEKEQGSAQSVREWLAWSRRYLAHIDPLRTQQRVPEEPEEIPPDELEPYLPEGVSPYGPRRW